MLNPQELFLQYFGALCAITVLFIGVGYALRSWYFRGQVLTIENVFYSILVGAIACVTAYAMLITHGVTINIVFFTFLPFLYYYRQSNIDQMKASEQYSSSVWHIVGVVFFTLLLSFTIWFSFTYDLHYNMIKEGHCDEYVYANVSQSMVDNGKENIAYMLNYYNPNTGADFYHYFELWVIGIVYDIFKLNAFLASRLVITPLFSIMFILGAIGFVENLFKTSQKWYLYFLGVSCIAICFPLPYINHIKYIHNFSELVFTFHMPAKKLVLFVFILAFAIQLYKKKYFGFLLSYLTLPIVSFTFVPFTAGLIITIYIQKIFFHLFKKKIVNIEFEKYGILTAHTVFFSIPLFYFFFKSNIGNFGDNVVTMSYILTIFISFCSVISKMWIKLTALLFLMTLFSVGLYYIRKKININFILNTGFLIVFTGIGTSGVLFLFLHKHMDAFQILQFPLYLFLRLFIILFTYICLERIIRNYPSIKYIPMVLFCILICNNLYYMPQNVYSYSTMPYKNSFFTNVLKANANISSPLVRLKDTSLFFKSKKVSSWDFTPLSDFPVRIDGYKRGSRMLDITDYYGLMEKYKNNKDVFPYPEAYKDQEVGFYRNPFFLFMQEQKKVGTFVDVPHSQVDFIKKHKIESLITDYDYPLMPELQSLVKKEVLDETKQLRFYLLAH